MPKPVHFVCSSPMVPRRFSSLPVQVAELIRQKSEKKPEWNDAWAGRDGECFAGVGHAAFTH